METQLAVTCVYFSMTLYYILQSSVEAGSTRMVSIAFHPPRGSCNQTIEAETNVRICMQVLVTICSRLSVSSQLTLKGDSVQVFKLLLRGMVCE